MLKTILRIEFAKYKFSWVLPLLIVLPLIVVGLQFREFKLSESVFQADGQWTWAYFSQYVRARWGAFIYPIVVALLVAYTCYVENRPNNWKLMLVQPIERYDLYIAKLIHILAGIWLTGAILCAGLAVGGSLLKLNGSWGAEDILWLLLVAPATWPVLAILLWLGTRFRSFFVPVSIGLAGHALSIIAGGTSIGKLFPWTFPLEALQVAGPVYRMSWWLFGLSIALGLLLTFLGGRHFSRKDLC